MLLLRSPRVESGVVDIARAMIARERHSGAQMSVPDWLDYAQGIGSVVTPLTIVGLGYVLAKRQSRNDVLLTARLEDYRRLVPNLNALMCYMTFIGDWKALTPPQVVQLKRSLDSDFFAAAPLFSAEVQSAYSSFMDRCFKTFNTWGSDARLLTSAFRRRSACPSWKEGWDAHFAYDVSRTIPASELAALRASYDELVAALVRDLDLTRARTKYTSDLVSLNAHAPRAVEISGDRDPSGPRSR